MWKSMLHISRVAWARWETYMPLRPTTPTETEHRRSGTQLHKTSVWGVLFLNLSFQHQITYVLENQGTVIQIQLFNTLYCFLNQHCADQHLFIVLLLSRCSSVAYISCLSANIFNLKLSEYTISWRSVLTIFMHAWILLSTCKRLLWQRTQRSMVFSVQDGVRLKITDWSSGFSWPLCLRLQNIHCECGKSS